MSTSHDFAILSRFKALHIEGTNKIMKLLKHELKLTSTLKFLGKGLRLCSFALLCNPKIC
jgi:hypothetical protein